ncbi:hypothetical protein AB4K20DRAFT_1914009 [Rhizopus microsporus]
MFVQRCSIYIHMIASTLCVPNYNIKKAVYATIRSLVALLFLVINVFLLFFFQQKT